MKKISYIGVLAALTYVCTAFVVIPLPNSGYANAGSIIIVITACLFGPAAGALVGVIGSALADATLGYFFWIPATIVVKASIGYLVGTGNRRRPLALPLYLAAGVIAVGGYYVAESVIYGNWVAPLAVSVPALAFEYAASLLIGLMIAKPLQRFATKL